MVGDILLQEKMVPSGCTVLSVISSESSWDPELRLGFNIGFRVLGFRVLGFRVLGFWV